MQQIQTKSRNIQKMNRPEKFKYLVTSALPYANNIPHLGTMVCVISADVYKRFLAMKGEESLSVLGTDEHGTTTEVKAIEEGTTPKEVCDKYFRIHKQVYEWFECFFDCFGRTSSEENREITQDIFNKLYKNSFIKKDKIKQAYCKSCKRFLADRFVEGKCPKCKYENARGDQCENCGELLNSYDLIGPRCKLCGSMPDYKDTEHLFIDLEKLQPELERWIKKQSAEGKWSENAKTMTEAWLKAGLKPRCITRDLKWGIPVPLKGFEGKVFYSWFDAPIGYISITKACRKDWKEWWHGKDVKLVQFMGKDNIPFHTIMFPGMLIGTRDNYVLLYRISSNEYINYEGGQFSKSRGRGVFGNDAMSTGIPPDAWRYYIMVNRPEKSDTDFQWDDFQAKINNELVANLGNFINRTVSFINSNFSSEIPDYQPGRKEEQIIARINEKYKKIDELLSDIQLKESLKEIMLVSKIGNQYFQESEPWKSAHKEKAATCLSQCANIAKDLSIIIRPYMPNTSESICRQLNIKEPEWNSLGKITIKKGHKISSSELLFEKLSQKQILGLKEKFKGSQEKNELKDKFSKADLRVAEIISAENHPDADKLYVLKINTGKEEKQIVAGLRGHYKKQELAGKKIVIVDNLQPANLRGIESRGMLLAAAKKQGSKETVRLIEAKKSNPGDLAFIEGIKPDPEKEISFEEFTSIRMITDEKERILYKGKSLRTKKEHLTAPGSEKGSLIR